MVRANFGFVLIRNEEKARTAARRVALRRLRGRSQRRRSRAFALALLQMRDGRTVDLPVDDVARVLNPDLVRLDLIS